MEISGEFSGIVYHFSIAPRRKYTHQRYVQNTEIQVRTEKYPVQDRMYRHLASQRMTDQRMTFVFDGMTPLQEMISQIQN